MNQTTFPYAPFVPDASGPQSVAPARVTALSPVTSRSGGRRSRTTLQMPSPICGPGVLHLCAATAQVRDRLEEFCAQSKRPCDMDGATLSVRVGETDLSALVLDVMDVLTTSEQTTTRAIFGADGHTLTLSDYFGVDTFANFACKTLCGWLIDAIENCRLDTAFQPIVRVNAPQEIFAFECLLRCKDGDKIISPGRMLEVARGAGLLFQLDLGARLAAIRAAARWHLSAKIFINFAPTALSDPLYALQTTVEAVDKVDLPREQIVFEVTENECIEDLDELKSTLHAYRAQGFGIALDDLGSGYSSLNLLADLRPDYVKLDRDLMRSVPDDPYRALIAQKLLETANALGIRTIAEGVENPAQCAWLQMHSGDYAQGFHFARPAAVPPLSMHTNAPCAS